MKLFSYFEKIFLQLSKLQNLAIAFLFDVPLQRSWVKAVYIALESPPRSAWHTCIQGLR